MSDQTFIVLPPDSEVGIDYYTVMGVAPEGQPSHYDIQAAVKDEFPNIKFDSEQGTFFAYAYGPKPAKRLADALNARYGQAKAPVPNIPAPTNPIVSADQARHAEFVQVIKDALLNISEAGEFFVGSDDPARAKADYIALKLRDKGLI